MEFYYFNNCFTIIMQGVRYNSVRLRTPWKNCHNLVTTLWQPYKVAARLLQPSYFYGKPISYLCWTKIVAFLRSNKYSNCHNLVTTLWQPYKVAARLLQPSYFYGKPISYLRWTKIVAFLRSNEYSKLARWFTKLAVKMPIDNYNKIFNTISLS